jgi:hypothetical protein
MAVGTVEPTGRETIACVCEPFSIRYVTAVGQIRRKSRPTLPHVTRAPFVARFMRLQTRR